MSDETSTEQGVMRVTMMSGEVHEFPSPTTSVSFGDNHADLTVYTWNPNGPTGGKRGPIVAVFPPGQWASFVDTSLLLKG